VTLSQFWRNRVRSTISAGVRRVEMSLPTNASTRADLSGRERRERGVNVDAGAGVGAEDILDLGTKQGEGIEGGRRGGVQVRVCLSMSWLCERFEGWRRLEVSFRQ
jgi:hypothetical protein